MAIVNPSKALAAIINEQGIQKIIQNICHDEQEEEEERKKAELNKQMQDDEDNEPFDEDITRLLADQPEDRRMFSLIKRDETQLFTFRDKEVNQLYNVLLNFVTSLIDTQVAVTSLASPVQIIAPSPFVSCTYNECQTFYSGKVSLANKQQRYQLKLYGVIFPYYLQSIS